MILGQVNDLSGCILAKTQFRTYDIELKSLYGNSLANSPILLIRGTFMPDKAAVLRWHSTRHDGCPLLASQGPEQSSWIDGCFL
jgi:hypothetical protein